MEAGQTDRAVLLAAAAAELLKVHALLAEHAVALGHVDKLLKMMQTNAPPAEGGCCLPCQSASEVTVSGEFDGSRALMQTAQILQTSGAAIQEKTGLKELQLC